MSDYLNSGISELSKGLGAVAEVELEYNTPVKVAQYVSAKGKTNQNQSLLKIQNLSTAFALEVFIVPDPTGSTEPHRIEANDRKPLQFVHNWDGSILHVTNVSQEASSAEVTLISLT